MGIKKFIRKVIPREIRENPLVGIVAVAVVGPAALASLGASAASLIGASTIAANTAASIAIGTGIVSSGVTFLQTGDVSDSLRAGVLSGVGSYAGQVVSSSVTDAVSRATGALPGQGISAGFGAGNQIVSTAGGQGFTAGATGFGINPAAGALGAGVAPTAAGVLAGNVLARSVEAAITGKPIEQAALFGAAQSIPFSLEQVGDFSSLDPIVKNVVASSAQAAVMGQDVGDAALAALIESSAIVSRAISEIPGGQEFIKQKPIYAKYVIDSVSSALAAQLLDKDVSEAVVYSLARTTAKVLNDEFKNSAKATQVENANQVYQEAEAKTARAREVADRLESINDDPKYARSINIINYNIDFIDNNLAVRYQESLRNYNAAYKMAQIAEENYRNATPEEQPKFEAEFRYQVDRANGTLRFLQEDQKAFDSAKNQVEGFKNDLTRAGYYNEVASLEDELNTLTADLTELTSNIEGTVNIIAQDASDLFRNFQVDVATTLAPLTGMDATDVTDADIVKEIQPPSQEIGVEVAGDVNRDAIRGTFAVPFAGENYSSPDKRTTINPQQGQTWQPYEVINRYVSGTKSDGTPYSYMITLSPETGVYYTNVQNAEDIVTSRQASYDAFAQYDKSQPDQGTNVAPEGWGLTGIGEDAGAGVVTEAPTGVGTDAGVGTGTPGAPPIDYSLAATEMQGTALDPNRVEPTISIGADLRDMGTGSPTSPNLAFFQKDGGGGGGSTEEVNWQIIAKDSLTGDDIVDVNGKLYALLILPTKQVLVPQDQTPVLYVELDPATKNPVFKAVDRANIPKEDAQKIEDKEIEKQVVQEATADTAAPGGDVTGAEGVAGDEGVIGGLTGETAAPPVQPVETTKSEAQKVTDQILQMAVGRIPTDLRYDLNKDGKVNSADAVAYLRGDRPILDAEIPLGEIKPDVVEDVGGIVGGGVGGDAGTTTPIDQLPDTREPVDTTGGGGGGGLGGPGGGVGDEITDAEIIGLIRDQIGDLGGGEGEGLPRGEGDGTGTDDEGTGLGGDQGEGLGSGDEGVGPGAGDKGTGPGQGGKGDGRGTGEGEGDGEGTPLEPPVLPPGVVTLPPPSQQFRFIPQTAPYRVTGQDESGILGRKQPLFGGDEDLQRAEWNRRSLRLKRLLGL